MSVLVFSSGYLVQRYPDGLLVLIKGEVKVIDSFYGPSYEVNNGRKITCQILPKPGNSDCKILVTENGVLEIIDCGVCNGKVETPSGCWNEVLEDSLQIPRILKLFVHRLTDSESLQAQAINSILSYFKA